MGVHCEKISFCDFAIVERWVFHALLQEETDRNEPSGGQTRNKLSVGHTEEDPFSEGLESFRTSPRHSRRKPFVF